MAGEAQAARRRDGVVIMARGLSRRMGSDKGLLRRPGDSMSFVRRIVGTYASDGRATRPWPLVVVTLPGSAAAYAAELAGVATAGIIGVDAGGDTALTVLEGWRHLNAAGRSVTHLWAHPCDMPLVAPETVSRLDDASHAYPDRVVRPVFEGRPGHPVVLPPTVLAVVESASSARRAPLRLVLDAAHRIGGPGLLEVAVVDEGTVTDFDTPEDLDAAPAPGKDEDDGI